MSDLVLGVKHKVSRSSWLDKYGRGDRSCGLDNPEGQWLWTASSFSHQPVLFFFLVGKTFFCKAGPGSATWNHPGEIVRNGSSLWAVHYQRVHSSWLAVIQIVISALKIIALGYHLLCLHVGADSDFSAGIMEYNIVYTIQPHLSPNK